MDSRDRTIVIIVLAFLVIIVIVVAIILTQGHGVDGMTPTMAMTHEGSAPGDYNFTVVGISENDVKWSDVQLVISPIGEYTTTLPSATAFISTGDMIGIANLTPNTTYTITVKYIPTGGAIYQITLTPN
jgi:hypothetical protein